LRAAIPSSVAEQAELLFEEQRLPLHRYLRAIGLQPEDCEDVMQETFLALHRHLVAEKPDFNLRGWLFRVAHNQAQRSRRSSRLYFWESILDRYFDPSPNPEELAWRAQRARRVWNVVRALPERDRACLALKAEGFAYREIGEIVGISLGSVAAAVARALDKVARMEDGGHRR